ncbi:membrane protease YdiL (CAAX protease family) [Friedmanniella endophytica]|uniref:Membrane protease YdiL (CAAX protease family) n=1 Tax=Microlunatus kandeliicorticis TaxID=1759536 RepID=A0A7W3IRF1_9ACTN|nr:CPBP family intramembrane glutamic endopeptidase [Microlunatus kandeliicorticis]MBA8793810.1 membrane protease YdiL (CAAX protease family) [Microlunatus kandeliicorticis]
MNPVPTTSRPENPTATDRRGPQPAVAIDVPDRVPWRAVGLFVLIAYALMWLFTVPFWLSPHGLAVPWMTPVLLVAMFSPALASLLVVRVVERRSWLRVAGLRAGRPGRVVRHAFLGLGLVVLALVLGVLVSGLAGVQRLDLTELSGVRLAQRAVPAPLDALPPAVYLVVLVASGLVNLLTVGTVSALGEETGWRGFLLSRLLPLGRVRAILLTGVVWGFWHTPLVLLGYEYPGANRLAALLLFVVFTVAFGALLAWLRLRSASTVPGAVAHAALNGYATLTFLLMAGGRPGPVLLGAPMGLVAIGVLVVLVAVLFALAPDRRPEGPVG